MTAYYNDNDHRVTTLEKPFRKQFVVFKAAVGVLGCSELVFKLKGLNKKALILGQGRRYTCRGNKLNMYNVKYEFLYNVKITLNTYSRSCFNVINVIWSRRKLSSRLVWFSYREFVQICYCFSDPYPSDLAFGRENRVPKRELAVRSRWSARA